MVLGISGEYNTGMIRDRHDEESRRIHIRLRCVIVHEEKLLVTYTKDGDFYFFPGGHMQWGESIIEGCQREIREELGDDVEFEFEKVLYMTEFIEPNKEKHSHEIFVLGRVNKSEELDGKMDPEHPDGSFWTTWLELDNLPDNLYPTTLAKQIAKEYKIGFPSQGEYFEPTKAGKARQQ